MFKYLAPSEMKNDLARGGRSAKIIRRAKERPVTSSFDKKLSASQA